MSTERTYQEIITELNAKLPREAVQTRDAGQGRTLDYVSGYYVVDRLNKTLGQGNWAYTSEVTKLHEGTLSTNRGDVHSVHYAAKVRLVATIAGKHTEFTDYGYGDGTDKNNPGKAHELAIKEAVTDGIKRCAKNLGMSFGLALYSKEQENVEETAPAPKPAGTPKPGPIRVAVSQTSKDSPVQAKVSQEPNLEAVLQKISLSSRVLVNSKRATLEELQGSLKTKYGVEKKEQLTLKQAEELAQELSARLNQ